MNKSTSLLIFDTDKMHEQRLLEYLANSPVQVHTLRSIDNLYDKVQTIQPQIILTDHKGVDRELAQNLMRIKSDSSTKDTPFFILADKLPKPLQNQYEIRGAEIVSKTVNPIELANTILPTDVREIIESGKNELEVTQKIAANQKEYLEVKVNENFWDDLRNWSSNSIKTLEEKIVLANLDECEYVNSEGIGTLITLLHECKNYGIDFYILCRNQHFRRTIEQSGLDRIFIIFNDIEDFQDSISEAA